MSVEFGKRAMFTHKVILPVTLRVTVRITRTPLFHCRDVFHGRSSHSSSNLHGRWRHCFLIVSVASVHHWLFNAFQGFRRANQSNIHFSQNTRPPLLVTAVTVTRGSRKERSGEGGVTEVVLVVLKTAPIRRRRQCPTMYLFVCFMFV